MNISNLYRKINKLKALFLGISITSISLAHAQITPTGTSCADAIPFCTGTTYNFPNIVNGTPAPTGLNYGCLGSQPNPVWYYFKIGNPGNLQIDVAQYTAASTGIDVDFAMWGPYASLTDACNAINNPTSPAFPIQSSFSGSFTETIGIGLPGGSGTPFGSGACQSTPPAALTGQYYVVLFTNYSNQPGNMVFSANPVSTATTDCSIINCGVTLTSNSPICEGDSIYITLDNTNEPEYTYNYVWSGPNGYSSTAKSPAIGGLLQGTYNYQVLAITQVGNVYDTCIEDIEVVVNPLKKTYIDEVICQGDSINWYGQKIGIAGVYDSIFPSQFGCDSIVYTTLSVVPKPQKIMMLDSIIVCQYDSVALESNTLPYSDSYTYNWNPSINLNTIDQPNVWFFADQSRSYVLTVTNTANGLPCSLTDTIDIIVNPGDFLIVPIKDTGICPGDTVQLAATGATSYHWTPATYLSNTDIPNPVTKAETSMAYQLIGTSDKGCTDTQIVNVTVHPAAVLELPDFVNIYPGETYNMQPGTNASYFHWFPNSGINNTEISNPRMNPVVDTRYFVTARTEYGCSVSDSVDFWVKGTVIDMPNAFDPNRETFKPVIRGIVSIQSFTIYNRWGQKLFETSNMNDGWNGYFNNVAQPMGVYVYSIDATTSEGKPFKQTGNFTLLR